MIKDKVKVMYDTDIFLEENEINFIRGSAGYVVLYRYYDELFYNYLHRYVDDYFIDYAVMLSLTTWQHNSENVIKRTLTYIEKRRNKNADKNDRARN